MSHIRDTTTGGSASARACTRRDLAGIRALLLDLLVTRDIDVTNAAMRVYDTDRSATGARGTKRRLAVPGSRDLEPNEPGRAWPAC
jgi:hypothetical protein